MKRVEQESADRILTSHVECTGDRNGVECTALKDLKVSYADQVETSAGVMTCTAVDWLGGADGIFELMR